MDFRIITLIDVTETGEHRGPNKHAIGQQANYDTLIQVVGLRANPTPIKTVEKEDDISNLGFGTNYKGVQKFWEHTFKIEYGLTTVDNLIQDFHLIPIVTGLNETIEINIKVIDTQGKETKNTIFEKLD